ncbi:hypothetical protein NDU88_006259, partial [Pleurodeles waltl]
ANKGSSGFFSCYTSRSQYHLRGSYNQGFQLGYQKYKPNLYPRPNRLYRAKGDQIT